VRICLRLALTSVEIALSSRHCSRRRPPPAPLSASEDFPKRRFLQYSHPSSVFNCR
jgi:hypothetical protein